jgi:hypothetical protein
MKKLTGDKDGLIGTYEVDGQRFEVQKFYAGKGIGARWAIIGKWFDGQPKYNFQDASKQVADWLEMGGRKIA